MAGVGIVDGMPLLMARHRPLPHPPKDVKVVHDAVVIRVLDIKVPDMPSFFMPKLDMPKIDTPSPPKFNVPVHPLPKPTASLSSLVPEFKVPDTAP